MAEKNYNQPNNRQLFDEKGNPTFVWGRVDWATRVLMKSLMNGGRMPKRLKEKVQRIFRPVEKKKLSKKKV